MKLKRYGCKMIFNGKEPMGEFPDGNYVSYSDYADLERRLADVLELLEPDKRAYMNPFWYVEENASEVYERAKAITEGQP